MIQLVLNDVGIELGQLIVHVGGTTIVLNVEIAVSEQGKSRAVSRRELKLICKDSNNLHILLIADERVDSLSVLSIGHGPELLLHVHFALKFS